MSATAADRRDDVVRLLADTPDGLSDGDLARALGSGVRPQSVNTLCRRLASAGVVERVGTRPIRNRLVADAAEVDGPAVARVEPAPADAGPDDTRPGTEVSPARVGPEDALRAAVAEDDGEDEAEGDGEDEGSRADAEAAGPTPNGRANGWTVTAGAHRPGPAGAVTPERDVLQAWSRTINVQAAVARWLRERGATIRSATLDGEAARDLVARIDGDDVHVEVTGWPPDGDRTHPTTIAADWFSAASRAAARRRDDRPHARLVVALPDTRRYRALAARDTALAGTRTEVWFVDPAGAVHETGGRTPHGDR